MYRHLLIALAISGCVLCATVQAKETRMEQFLLSGGTLEKYLNPEARRQAAKHTPLMTIPLRPAVQSMVAPNGFASVQVNIDDAGMNIPGDAGNETSIAVNPQNPMQMAIGWRQFDTNTNSFRQAGRAYSEDGGQSWIANGVFDPGVFRSDPVLAADGNGVLYYQSLRVDNLNQPNETFGVQQFASMDGGKTWGPPVEVHGGDKTWFAIDSNAIPPPGVFADPPATPLFYAAWNTAGNAFGLRTFSRSLDNGMSYDSPSLIPNQPVFGTVAIGGNGEVYVVGQVFGGFSSTIHLLRADNAFDPAQAPNWVLNKTLNLGGQQVLGASINPEGLLGQIWVATHGDNVYVLASVDPPGPDPLDVMFIRSSDRGETFSTPLRINDDAVDSNAWQWFGSMAVAPNGRIDVIWNDTRADPVSNHSELYYSFSNDGGQRFTPNQVASPQYDQSLGYPVQRKMGDYYDIVSDNGGAHIAYAATFNGEEDVYYLHATPSAVPENPYFAALDMNNAWVIPGSPSQGILSTSLINGNTGKAMEFSALFTYRPDGTPTWLILQGDIPQQGNSYSLALLEPTGDLSSGGRPLTAVGLVTKSRPLDAAGNVIPGKVHYRFDNSDAIKPQLITLLNGTGLYDETEFNASAFHGLTREADLVPLIPRYQTREVFCSPYGQVLVDPSENNEGRLQYTFTRDGVTNLFGADFSYEKTVQPDGSTQLVLDANGRARPVWTVFDNFSNAPVGVDGDDNTQATLFTPNGGVGFLGINPNDPGVTATGSEQDALGQDSLGQPLIDVTKSDGSRETLKILAGNTFCGQVSTP